MRWTDVKSLRQLPQVLDVLNVKKDGGSERMMAIAIDVLRKETGRIVSPVLSTQTSCLLIVNHVGMRSL